MSEEKEEQKIIMFMYIKDGKEFHTPNEQIAAQRSDSGDYFRVSYDKSNTGILG
jgi:hypothetical protein